MVSSKKIARLKEVYDSVRHIIIERIKQFEKIREKASKDDVMKEFIFCLLTPQSRAKLCWNAVLELCSRGNLENISDSQVLICLSGVRFKSTKARRIAKFISSGGKNSLINAISRMNDPFELREWLVENVDGFGYKEASHFLRNIGLGSELAILDRHILKNLKEYQVIPEIPKSLTRKRYLEVEDKMRNFAERVKIPMSHLDLLFWYMETGEVFK